jgi:predicted Holliday junction resolvase-like endonuclease
MNEVDFRDKLASTAANLQENAQAAAEEAMRAVGLAQVVNQEVQEGQLLEAAEMLEHAREALIEAGQNVMAGMKGTRLQPLSRRSGD